MTMIFGGVLSALQDTKRIVIIIAANNSKTIVLFFIGFQSIAYHTKS